MGAMRRGDGEGGHRGVVGAMSLHAYNGKRVKRLLLILPAGAIGAA
jgi:hypothetical protein